jgi:hypothetical protein
MSTPVTDVAERFAAAAEIFQQSQSDRIVRPDPGIYDLFLTGGRINDDVTFFNEGDLNIPGISFTANWLLPAGDVEGEDELKFPGKFWVVPLGKPEEMARLPANQKQRADIFWPQFKTFVTGMLGYDPATDYVDALRGLFSAAAESHEKGESMKYSVQIKNRTGKKSDPTLFDREVPLSTV